MKNSKNEVVLVTRDPVVRPDPFAPEKLIKGWRVENQATGEFVVLKTRDIAREIQTKYCERFPDRSLRSLANGYGYTILNVEPPTSAVG